MHSHSSKVSVIGAGAVGASMAYAMLIRESAREVVLYDVNEAKVTAEVLDLAHGTQFTGSSAITGGSDITLTIVREGEQKPLIFKLTRALIKVASVRSRMLEPGGAFVAKVLAGGADFQLILGGVAQGVRHGAPRLRRPAPRGRWSARPISLTASTRTRCGRSWWC